VTVQIGRVAENHQRSESANEVFDCVQARPVLNGFNLEPVRVQVKRDRIDGDRPAERLSRVFVDFLVGRHARSHMKVAETDGQAGPRALLLQNASDVHQPLAQRPSQYSAGGIYELHRAVIAV
jgi:hypothetical protein